MSINELNSAARDLISVRQMIEQLQAEAEALTDKLKAAMVDQGTAGRPRGRTSIAAGSTARRSRPTTPICIRPIARPPPAPALSSAYEKGPYPVPPTKADRVEATTKTTGALVPLVYHGPR